jgi:FAD/FMN-containing dehydrogenase
MPERTPLSIEKLRADITGAVTGPDDHEYDEARAVFPGGIDKRPAAIVRVADAEDVARVIALARGTGLELAVRSGGHSGAGHGVSEGGIVLDLRGMRRLDIDVDGRSAWAETGLTAAEYTAATAAHGLATGFGDTGSVGIGGITNGGGIGFLSRKFGMTIDSLVAAEVVTADGELQHVDAETEPDLFWAIRGGGGNVGVATRARFRLHDVGQVVGGMLFLPATPDTVASFIAAAEAAPDDLTTIANVMPAPPMPFLPEEHHGDLVIFALITHAGGGEDGERAVAPFRAIARPIADMVRPMSYPEMYLPEDPDYHPAAVARNMFLDGFDRDTAALILERLEASDSPMRVAQIRVHGGAISRVPNDATAFAHRDRPIMANVAALYEDPAERPARQAWVDETWKALDPALGAYVGFLSDEGEARVHEAYPDPTWDRLATIKSRYDPLNVFRLNQNVPPLTDGEQTS